MKFYTALQTVTLRGGRLHLTADQFRRRVNKLKPTDDKGVYELIDTTMFKAGEVFGYDGEVNKLFAGQAEETESETSKKEAPKKFTKEESARGKQSV